MRDRLQKLRDWWDTSAKAKFWTVVVAAGAVVGMLFEDAWTNWVWTTVTVHFGLGSTEIVSILMYVVFRIGFPIAILALAMWFAFDLGRMQSNASLRSNPHQQHLMSLVALRDLAAELNWDFGRDSLQLLDFERALQEAGARGLLEFYARENHDNISGSTLRNRPRVPVPAIEWRVLCLDSAGGMSQSKNIETALRYRYNVDDRTFRDIKYSDLHVRGHQVQHWLRHYAEEFKGQRASEKLSVS